MALFVHFKRKVVVFFPPPPPPASRPYDIRLHAVRLKLASPIHFYPCDMTLRHVLLPLYPSKSVCDCVFSFC